MCGLVVDQAWDPLTHTHPQSMLGFFGLEKTDWFGSFEDVRLVRHSEQAETGDLRHERLIHQPPAVPVHFVWLAIIHHTIKKAAIQAPTQELRGCHTTWQKLPTPKGFFLR